MNAVTQKTQAAGNELAGWAARNRMPLAAAGVAAAALLAVRARGRAAAAPARGPVVVGDPQEFRGLPAYDSTANDVYSALQGEVEAMGDRISETLAERLKPVVPKPAPKPPAPKRRPKPGPRPIGTTMSPEEARRYRIILLNPNRRLRTPPAPPRKR